MEKALNLCNLIRKDLSLDYTEQLEDAGLLTVFQSVMNLPKTSIEDKNRVVCYIVFAYSPESQWVDLQKDRMDVRVKILDRLGANTKDELFLSILDDRSDLVGISLFKYLEELKDYRWQQVFSYLDFAAKLYRFAHKNTPEEKTWEEINKDGNKQTLKEDIDLDKVAKINKEKSNLLEDSFAKREAASALIDKIKRDFVQTDNATQQDFGFNFSETSKKRDPLSWRQFIRERNARKSQPTQPA